MLTYNFESATFCFWIEKFPIHTCHIQIKFTCLHSRKTRPTQCAAILVYCSVKDWTQFCYVIRSENIWICHPHVIEFSCGFFFPLWRADLKISGFAAEFARCMGTQAISMILDAWGQRPYDTGCMGTEAISERKSCGFNTIWMGVDGPKTKG